MRSPPRDAAAGLRARWFPALACDPDDALFTLAPDALGFGVLLRPLSGGGDAVREKLNALLNLGFPAGTLLQAILYASPDIERSLYRYARQRDAAPHPLLVAMTAERLDFLRAGTGRAIDRISGTCIRNVQVVLAVRVPVGSDAPSAGRRHAVAELRLQFIQTLRAIGLAYEPLAAATYLRFMQTLLNPRPEATWRDSPLTGYDDSVLLSEQILDADSGIEIDARGLWLGNRTQRVALMSVKRLPETSYFGVAARFLGDFMSGARGIRGNALIAVNVHYPDHERLRGRLELDQQWATRQAEGRIAKFVPAYGWRRESLDLINAAIAEGDRVVQCYLSLALFASGTDAATAAASNARTYLRECGLQMMHEELSCGLLFPQMLPFGADPAAIPSLMKYKTVATRHALPLLPLMGSWVGAETPALALIARDGQLMQVNPFESTTNFNACIAAQSGAGKSFFTNELITSFLAAGARAWVIDVGGSYRHTCELVGGYHLEFRPEREICLNPFSLVERFDDEADMLAGIVAVMAAPKDGLDDYQTAGLKRCLKATFEALGPEMSIDDLAAALSAEPDRRLTDIGAQLFPFRRAGEYGRYFCGRNTFEAESPFIVCELEELKGRPHLQRVVLLQLIYQINQRMFLGRREQRKLLVIDEAWDLLASDQTRDFITASYRRCRKVNGATITVTQSVSDYYANAGAQAIVENSANFYLLSQRAESIAAAEREGRLPIGAAGIALLKTLTTVPGEYSEILVRDSNSNLGVGRLVVPPFAQLLYSTRAEEVAEIRRLRDGGLSVEQALRQLLERRRVTQRQGGAVP